MLPAQFIHLPQHSIYLPDRSSYLFYSSSMLPDSFIHLPEQSSFTFTPLQPFHQSPSMLPAQFIHLPANSSMHSLKHSHQYLQSSIQSVAVIIKSQLYLIFPNYFTSLFLSYSILSYKNIEHSNLSYN